MKKIYLLMIMLLIVGCGTIGINLSASYTMDNGMAFMCDVIVKVEGEQTPEGAFNCEWKIPTDTAVYQCSVSMDKLKKGYKPNLDLDCTIDAGEIPEPVQDQACHFPRNATNAFYNRTL